MVTLCLQIIKIKINNLLLQQQEIIYSVTIITQLIQQVINLILSESKEVAIPQEACSIIKIVLLHSLEISLLIMDKKQIINNKVPQLILQQGVCLISEEINKIQLGQPEAYLEIIQPLKNQISNQQLVRIIYSEIITKTKLQINQHKLNPQLMFSKIMLPNNKPPSLLTISSILMQQAITKIIHRPQVICLQEQTSLQPKINLAQAVVYLQIIKTLNKLRVIPQKKKITLLVIQQIIQAEVLCLVSKIQVL